MLVSDGTSAGNRVMEESVKLICLKPNVGNIAINDAFMLEAAIYYLLKEHFRQEKYYVDLLELFLEVCQLVFAPTLELIFADDIPNGVGPADRSFDGAGGSCRLVQILSPKVSFLVRKILLQLTIVQTSPHRCLQDCLLLLLSSSCSRYAYGQLPRIVCSPQADKYSAVSKMNRPTNLLFPS